MIRRPTLQTRPLLPNRSATFAITPSLAALLAAPGVIALVLDPLRWLWTTWHDPSYQSDGMLAALVLAGLIAASLLSGPARPDPRAARRAWWLLGMTAAVRLVGRWLAVDTIGAVALVFDVAAIAILLGVARRPFALHPGVLACFAGLTLPIEHLVQRLLGHPLQRVAASVSELLLAPFFSELSREGVLLMHPGVELAVDLPCSGARGLVLFGAIALGFWTRKAPGFGGIVQGLAAVLFGALAANVMRIVGLFVGGVADVAIIDEPWHSLLGASSLGIAALPLVWIALRAPGREPARLPTRVRIGLHEGRAASLPWPAAAGLGVLGIAVAAAPAHPVDVSPPAAELRLPATLGSFVGADVPLREHERRYYDTWGGFAQKRVYDDGAGLPHTALLVRTRSPLRHLHGPDRCLIGAGHEVTRLGVMPGAAPAIVYRSVAPDGRAWRVEASFVSDDGSVATSVSEVVWRWLEAPEIPWSLVERISIWESCEAAPERCRAFERALFASLDLPLQYEH